VELYYRTAALESIARKILKRFDENYLNLEPQAVPLEKIVEQTFGLTLEYVYITEKMQILGRMVYDNGFIGVYNPELENYELFKVSQDTILIDVRLLEDPKLYGRYRFTLAHELAHWVLHKKLFQGTRMAAATDGNILNDDSLERQSNNLAKAILMPAGQLKRAFYGLAIHKNMGRNTKETGIQKLADIFEVSNEAMRYRLQEFRLL